MNRVPVLACALLDRACCIYEQAYGTRCRPRRIDARAAQVPRRCRDEDSRLIEAVQAGTMNAKFKLGTRRLDDGRYIEIELVARIPEGKWDGVAKSWGQIPPRLQADEKA